MARGLVDRVVVGADRIAANGDVANKIGTYPLAVLADRHGIPFYVAAPRLDTRPGDPRRRRASRSRSATRRRARGRWDRGACNLAFDVTPAELVTAIVTEAGMLEAALRRGDRPCTGGGRALRIASSRAREMMRLGLVAGSSGNVSAREGEVVHITPQRPALRGHH